MKFLEILRFEFTSQIRQSWFWLMIVIVLFMTIVVSRDGSVSEILYEDFFFNSPFAIGFKTVFGSLIWIMVAAAVVGEAAARDVSTGMYPLTYTAPFRKIEFLAGRFFAGFLLHALILIFVQVGIILAVYLPGVHPDAIQPFRPAAYFTAFMYIALPTAFVASSIQFLFSAISGRPAASYVGSLILFFMTFFIASAVLYHKSWGYLLDPIGFRFIVEDLSRLWTTTEKNWRLIAMEGALLNNRLLWMAISLLTLATTYTCFRRSHRSQNSWLKRKIGNRKSQDIFQEEYQETINVPVVPRRFGFHLALRQTATITWASFKSLTISWTGFFILIFIPLLMIPVIADQMVSEGVRILPTTILVLNELTDPLTTELGRWVIIPLLLIFLAGELVWKEREAKMADIQDTFPGSEWPSFCGKFLGLVLLLVLFMTTLMVAGIVTQLMMNYHTLEIDLYFKILLGLQLPEYLLFAVIALAVHVIVDHKYMGHLLGVLIYVIISLAFIFGIEHNMLIYGGSPEWTYTDMRGFGGSLGPWLWFKLYWTAWALLLMVVARLLWVRGREGDFRTRLELLPRRFSGYTKLITLGALIGIFVIGGFVFYNTNILNSFYTLSEKAELKADYEKKYSQYSGIPQPQLTGTSLHVEIYPEDKKAEIKGVYQLENKTEKMIDSIHIATVPGVQTKLTILDESSAPDFVDDDLEHNIFVLEKPLEPGDSISLNFQVLYNPKGFTNEGVPTSVVENGSYFMNQGLPSIGYQRSRELIGAADRREYGLPEEPLIPSLYSNHAKSGSSGGVKFEAVIGTKENQIAVAPGILRRSWTQGDRSYYHYSTDGTIGGEWGFFSANYAIHEFWWKNPDPAQKDVQVLIFHHPGHTAHLQHISQGIKESLNYYTEKFGPYEYNHLTVVEAPGNGVGMHAEASILSYSEGFTRLNPEEGNLDYPFAIVAHEMAHQWTVPYAFVEGAPVVSESLAWYYAMKAVENSKGKEHLQKLLNFMRQPNPIAPIRRGEPLLRGLDPYLSYRKGPLVLYALSKYIGEEKVNLALRRLVENHMPPGSPLATTLDIYEEIKEVTPDSLQYLLHDMMEVNTYWSFDVQKATANQNAGEKWEVTIDVNTNKIVFDEAGNKKAVPVNDWVELAIFGRNEGDSSNLIYQEKHFLDSRVERISLTVPEKPDLVEVDPNQLLIYLEPENNIGEIKFQE